MRKTVLAVLAATAVMFCPPTAYADPPNDATIAGGCVAHSVSDTVDADARVVVLSAFAVAHSPTPGHNPVTLTSLTCQLKVNGLNGSTYFATTASSVGVLTPQGYTGADDSDVVDICTSWTTVDAHFQAKSGNFCQSVTDQGVPPQPILDLVEQVVCTVTSAIAPVQISTVLYIAPGGDVYILGTRVFNCFPY